MITLDRPLVLPALGSVFHPRATTAATEACLPNQAEQLTNGLVRNEKKRDRRGEFLFIDARNIGYMRDRVLRDFSNDDIARIADTYHAWQRGNDYADVAGFCKSASLESITKHDFVLTPGRYVGAEEQEDDGEPFAEKMTRLTGLLSEQFVESARLEGEIKNNLAGLGYEL